MKCEKQQPNLQQGSAPHLNNTRLICDYKTSHLLAQTETWELSQILME